MAGPFLYVHKKVSILRVQTTIRNWESILLVLAVAGAVTVAATSPYSGIAVWNAFKRRKKYPKRRFADTFTRLTQKNLITIQPRGSQFVIALTKEGKKHASYMQINELRILTPKKWDGKWRLVLFDIANLKSAHRNAFRSKLQGLGFVQFQKSVWAHPFLCRAEIDLLCDFFGLSKKEVCVIVATHIDNDKHLKKHFSLRP